VEHNLVEPARSYIRELLEAQGYLFHSTANVDDWCVELSSSDDSEDEQIHTLIPVSGSCWKCCEFRASPWSTTGTPKPDAVGFVEPRMHAFVPSPALYERGCVVCSIACDRQMVRPRRITADTTTADNLPFAGWRLWRNCVRV